MLLKSKRNWKEWTKITKTLFEIRGYPEKLLRNYIDNCDARHHFQQIAFSVHGKCLTQICFSCQRVRTTYDWEEWQ